MIKHTQLSDALDIAREEVKYDEHVKNILSNKYILANIMQNTIDECQNMSKIQLPVIIWIKKNYLVTSKHQQDMIY